MVIPAFARGILRPHASRLRTKANSQVRTVAKEKLSLKVPGVMLPAVPRVTTGAWNHPVQINRSKQSKTRFHNVVEAGVVAVQSHRR